MVQMLTAAKVGLTIRVDRVGVVEEAITVVVVDQVAQEDPAEKIISAARGWHTLARFSPKC